MSVVFGSVQDPVHDDETHAANHHYDSTRQKQDSLERKIILTLI